MKFIAFCRFLIIIHIRLCSQASGNYDPSLVTEALREIQHSDIPNQDINLLKDVAVQVYLG